MKSLCLLFFGFIFFFTGMANPVQPRYDKDTLYKKSRGFTDWFKIKKQKKVKKTQDVDCWICEPLDYASDTVRRSFTPKNNDPCSAFVWLLMLPVIILIAILVAIYAAFIIGLILLLGSAILFGLYVLLLFAMGIVLSGWYLWGGIIGSIIVFTAFYFLFCHFCRK